MSSTNRFWIALGCFALLSGCSKLLPVDTGTSVGHGIVRRVDFQHHMITLDHDIVPKLIQAMTFAYPVKNDSIMKGLQPDDEVNFTLQESKPGEFEVLSVTKIANAPQPLIPKTAVRSAPTNRTPPRS